MDIVDVVDSRDRIDSSRRTLGLELRYDVVCH